MCYYIETGEFMDSILDRRKNLIKKRNIINLMLIPCWMLSFFISIISIINVLPIIEFLTIIIKMDYIDRNILLSFLEFFYKYLPTMVYIGGRVYIFNLNKKILKIEMDNDFDLLLEKEKMLEKKQEYIIVDEEEIRKIYDIVLKIEKLPRSKQMEVLNYIKGDLKLYDKELSSEIDLIGDKYKEYLLIECEDILFPNVEYDVKKYIRKKK